MNSAQLLPEEPIFKEITTVSGKRVVIYHRPLARDTKELNLDLEPFFHLPTLLRYTITSGETITIIGLLMCAQIEEPGNWYFSIRSRIDSKVHEVRLDSVSSALLTVWRINGSLDALQVLIEGEPGIVYIQTGGAGLLEIFASEGVQFEHAVSEILEHFNRPIKMAH